MLRFWKNTALMGLPFGLFMGLGFLVFFGDLRSLVLGLAGGPFFGLAMAAFMEWQRWRFTREDPCDEGEYLLKQGPANQFRGWEGVGGWLYLTDRRLLFRPHRFNVQNRELSIPLGEIREVRACLTVGIIPNGLLVTTDAGPRRFVVEERRRWVAEICHAKLAARPAVAAIPPSSEEAVKQGTDGVRE